MPARKRGIAVATRVDKKIIALFVTRVGSYMLTHLLFVCPHINAVLQNDAVVSGLEKIIIGIATKCLETKIPQSL